MFAPVPLPLSLPVAECRAIAVESVQQVQGQGCPW